MATIHVAVVTAVLAAAASAAPARSATQPAPETGRRELQQAIDSVDPYVDEVLGKKGKHANIWVESIAAGSLPFFEVLGASPDREEVLDAYIAAFGRNGWRTDLDLALIAPDLIMPSLHWPWAPRNGFGPKEQEFVRWVANSIAKRQVDRFQSDPAYFLRLYSLMTWSGRLFRPMDFGAQRSSFKRVVVLCNPASNNGEDTWWQIRDLFFICHAVGRDDLCKGITTDNYAKRFASLVAFMDNDVMSSTWLRSDNGTTWHFRLLKLGATEDDMVLHLPDRPFPDAPQATVGSLDLDPFEWKAVQNATVWAAKNFAPTRRSPTQPGETIRGRS
jgi:diadenosine tetraphosphatase ApaH/serine/threonine PP2A family protein phosphatase